VALLTIPNTSASATATPIVNGGFITGANVTSGGSGYVLAPTVTVYDSTGIGAVIIANISGGSVVSLTVQNPGSSYSGGTTLTLTAPPSNASQVFSGVNIFNGVNTFTNTSNGFTGSFTGNGAGLTNLGAINLSGIVPDARLSANVALLNGSPNFSGAVTASSFSGSGTSLTGLNASQLASGTVPAAALGNAWQVGGNSGTTPGTQFVGTTDNQALEFKVNGSRALRLEPNATSPNVIGGYSGNHLAAGLAGATISGGGWNGNTNSIFADYSAIGGGIGNAIQPSAPWSTIGGGYNNTIQPSAYYSAIGGGGGNTIQTGASDSTIGGGSGNTIQTNANDSTIGGGMGNTIQTNGQFAMIPGGRQNLATNYAFAAGYNARATNTGAFVWSDSTGTLTASTNANSVTMRASGGFRFFTGTGPVGASLAAGGTAWGVISDRNAKKNFQPVDGLEVLEKLSAIPVQHWNYKWEPDDAVPHIGPMAQDFKSAFYPGRDDKSITTLEFDGVELAAIQGLNQKLEETRAENAELKQNLAELKQLVQSLAEKK